VKIVIAEHSSQDRYILTYLSMYVVVEALTMKFTAYTIALTNRQNSVPRAKLQVVCCGIREERGCWELQGKGGVPFYLHGFALHFEHHRSDKPAKFCAKSKTAEKVQLNQRNILGIKPP
jgi:predicted metal-dependent hydrolase